MADNNRTCIVCGKKYGYCGHCSDNAYKNDTWRNIYCSENCRNIFDILSAHAFNHIDDQQAKEKLKNTDLSKLDSFRKDLKDQVKKIQNAEVKTQQMQNKPFEQNKHQQNQNQIVKENFKK